jgi:D-glycero-alpha-D-manno-heptose 1-phosphate guanylyltransferase
LGVRSLKISNMETKLSAATAVILVGGLGSRLRSVVSDRPKVLAEVSGRPFLAYILNQIAAAGITRVVLCTGYKGEQVYTTFGEAYAGIKIVYSQEQAPLGTAGALYLALPLIQSDPFIVFNGDSICNVDLNAYWKWHLASDSYASLVMAQVPEVQRYGSVRIDENDNILNFTEKNHTGEGMINAGIYLISLDLLKTISADAPVSLERDIFPGLIPGKLRGYQSKAQFLDIGTPDAYNQAANFLENTFAQATREVR